AGCSELQRRHVKPPHSGQPSVYLFMGFGDQAWSGGLYKLASNLRRRGCYTRVESYISWRSVVKDIIRDSPEQIALIGHSSGGNAAVDVARALEKQNIPVRVLIMLDGSSPSPIPANVDVAVHYYIVPTTFMLGRGPRDSLAKDNTHTQLINIAVGPDGTVSSTRHVDHLNIDDSSA